MGRADHPADTVTVAEAMAMAEAWNERAALLSTMGFELYTVFGAMAPRMPPAYLIRRLSGGASAANPELVEDVRAELFAAAESAREQARRILASISNASPHTNAHALDGEGVVAPRVDWGAIKVPTGGDEIVANPDCPAHLRKLGTYWPAAPVEEEAHEGAAAEVEERHASVTPLRPKRTKRSR